MRRRSDTAATRRRSSGALLSRQHNGPVRTVCPPPTPVNPCQIPLNIDLIDFPTIFWAEIEYSIYALRQASRRSWRIGQAHPVEVYFAVYDGTMQAEALALVGRKLRAALLVEGELPQEGLATQDLDDGDLMLTLAKRLAAGERADTQALEALFAESRALEAGGGETLGGLTWEACGDLDQNESVPLPCNSAIAASAATTQQLALPTPLMAPRSSGDETTSRDEADPTRLSSSTSHHRAPTAPLPAGAFIPSAGTLVPLAGWLGLTAPPAPRRRKQPARDQLKLFG